MQDIIITKSEAETKSVGERLAREARAGGIYALIGDLGCGKTVFTKGFAKGLGVEDYVDSPTFTIVKEYDEGLVRRLIESITIYDDHIMVTFKSGIEIDVTA